MDMMTRSGADIFKVEGALPRGAASVTWEAQT